MKATTAAIALIISFNFVIQIESLSTNVVLKETKASYFHEFKVSNYELLKRNAANKILQPSLLVSAQSKTSDEFPEKSEKCFQKERLPSAYKSRFQSFQYPNEDIVHKYIHCVSSELDIWDDANGFNVEKISQQYRSRANEEIVIPVISKCNLDNQNRNKELWCYRSFLCILNTQVGEWFKEDVQRKQQPNTLPNGHL